MQQDALPIDTALGHMLSIFAGMGLFFVGIKLLKTQVSHLTGPRFRAFLQKVSNSPPKAALLGIVTGLFTQSGRVAAILLASLTSSGLMNPRQALHSVLWANLGCSLIVITAVLPVHLVVLCLIGLAGTCFAFDFPKRASHIHGALFSLALFMFGLSLIKNGSIFFVQQNTLGPIQTFIHSSPALAFLLGVLLTSIIQSHIGVILISIAMAQAGIFTPGQTLMIVYGAHLGSSVVTWLFSIRSFEGPARHVLLLQILFNVAGVALFVSLFAIENTFHIRLVQGLSAALFPAQIGAQAAMVTILFNFVTASLLSLLARPYLKFITHLWPSTQAEELSKPKYINHESIDQPETAILLAGKEQVRLLGRLPAYLDSIRSDAPPSTFDLDRHHAAFGNITYQIESHLSEVMQNASDVHTSERLINLQNRQDPLRAIEADSYALCELFKTGETNAALAPLISNIVEALDTVLLTLISCIESADEIDLEQLARMTSDKGDLIRNLRRRYLATEGELSPADRAMILQATNLFERMIWTMGRAGKLVAEQPLVLA